MLTPEKLHEMTPEERLAAFDRWVIALYGENPSPVKVTRELGVSRPTYYNWRLDPKRIPIAVLLLLQEWSVSRHKHAAMLRGWNEITDHLAAIATTLQTVAALSQELSDATETEQEPASAQSS